MQKLRDIFDKDEILPSSRAGLNKNYRFLPEEISGFSGCKIGYQEVRLLECPLYLVRKYFLINARSAGLPLQITFSLAWDGFERALDFLFGYTESLDLFFNPANLIDARTLGIGNFGVAWWWVSEEINVFAFIRNNVFVCIQGFLPRTTMISAARSIDDGLKQAGTTDEYQEEKQGFFTQNLKSSPGTWVRVGGRLDIGHQNPGKETFFFQSPKGSMNRDLMQPDLWYFRAGTEKGPLELTLFRVGDGILPVKESLQIEVGGG